MQNLRRVLWAIGLGITVGTLVFISAMQLVTRWYHPEYTETQLFFMLLKPTMISLGVVFIGALLAITNKDAL